MKFLKLSWQPVKEKDLPVKLPNVKDWRPKGTGRGPLAQLKDWIKVKCPRCGGLARRETDVSDTFLDSAWYFLRYPSVGNTATPGLRFRNPGVAEPWDPQITKKWLPVDMYIGGAEHACIISLGVQYDDAQQAWFAQVAGFDQSTSNFDKTGPLDEAIEIYDGSANDYRDYFKAYLREWQRTYSDYNLLTEQGFSSLTYIAYRIPLSNADDIKNIT